MRDRRKPRVVIAHDDLTQRGGAEQVVLSLRRLFPEAPIVTTVYDPDGTYPDFRDLDVRTTFLQRLPHRGAKARALLPLYPAAVRALEVPSCDLLISSSSRFAHGVDARGAFHLSYCHSPARFLYQGDEYFAEGAPVPRWVKGALTPVLAGLRHWDRRAATRPDAFVANSQVVAGRIARLYGRDAHVVNPPVDVRRFPRLSAGPPDRDGYFLVVARLLAYKRIDLVIQACRTVGSRLVVVGTGPAAPRLRRIAGPETEFRSGVDDAELNRLLHQCIALVQPGLEDFGLAPLEANAAGRPAVAYGRGGATESVVPGRTGILFPEQTAASLAAALDDARSRDWDGPALRAHAVSRGDQAFHAAILDVLRRHGVVSPSRPGVEAQTAAT